MEAIFSVCGAGGPQLKRNPLDSGLLIGSLNSFCAASHSPYAVRITVLQDPQAGTVAEHGTFLWNELETPDQKKAGEFYSRLLGWTRHQVDAGPFGVYTLFERNGKAVAGMMNPTTDYSRSRGPAWNAYVAVDDVDACVSHVAEFGGRLIVAPHDVPDVGRVCMLADPTGAVILVMTPVAVPA